MLWPGLVPNLPRCWSLLPCRGGEPPRHASSTHIGGRALREGAHADSQVMEKSFWMEMGGGTPRRLAVSTCCVTPAQKVSSTAGDDFEGSVRASIRSLALCGRGHVAPLTVRRLVAEAPVADLALLDQLADGGHLLLERRDVHVVLDGLVLQAGNQAGGQVGGSRPRGPNPGTAR